MTVSGEPIPFHRPSLGTAERDAVLEVLESGWLTTGRRTAEFESAFAAFIGSAEVVAVNSATAALHLAFEAIGVSEGDEVIVPTYTFAASAETILYQHGVPILVDVDPVTTNVASSAISDAIGPKTRAIEVVHIGGLPAAMKSILSVAGSIPIVEDAAHSFPSPIASLNRKFAGTVGRAGAFSFYATKTITTGEGGMLATNDPKLAERARTMRLHGISRDAWKRYSAEGTWYYEIEASGFKMNPTDIASAIGLAQLGRAQAMRASRAAIAARYLDEFSDIAREGLIDLPDAGAADEHAWHLFVIRIGASASRGRIDLGSPGVAGLPPGLRAVATKRAHAIDRLKELGVGTSVHFIPLHLHPLYRQMGYRPGQFPAAEAAYAGAISLPIWPGMTDSDIGRVSEAVKLVTTER